jgi:hypothetical protein
MDDVHRLLKFTVVTLSCSYLINTNGRSEDKKRRVGKRRQAGIEKLSNVFGCQSLLSVSSSSFIVAAVIYTLFLVDMSVYRSSGVVGMPVGCCPDHRSLDCHRYSEVSGQLLFLTGTSTDLTVW